MIFRRNHRRLLSGNKKKERPQAVLFFYGIKLSAFCLVNRGRSLFYGRALLIQSS